MSASFLIHLLQPEEASHLLPLVHIMIGNLKKFLNGTFHEVSYKYLQEYVSGFCYRFNRRFWEPGHPYSAWLMNTLSKGTIIKVIDEDGSVYKYSIVSQTIKDGNDLSTFNASNDDLLKIVTCSRLLALPQRWGLSSL